MSKSTEDSKPSNSVELEFKATVLRPLAHKFQELTRQIDSGEYRLPKTMQEAEKITESYIEQAWERAVQLFDQEIAKRVEETRIDDRKKLRVKFGKLDAAIFAVRFYLDQPYPDDARWTPYTRFVGPRMEMMRAALKGEDIGDLEGIYRIASLNNQTKYVETSNPNLEITDIEGFGFLPPQKVSFSLPEDEHTDNRTKDKS